MAFWTKKPPEPPARMVRLHTTSPGEKTDLTFEGLLIGVRDGHYILERPRALDSAEGVDEPPRGTVYEIPVARVWFREILVQDAEL